MRVSEVMTINPTCCIPTDSAKMAATIMRDLDIGIVPIVENGMSRKLVGVVTDRDLCIGLICGNEIADSEPHSADTALEDLMTSNVISCRPGDSLQKALELMKENQIRRILVVDEEGAVEGIISMADLFLRADVTSRETSGTMKIISEPAEEEAPRPNAQHAKTGR